ncbi:MAG: heavy metal translocating P-type ATPase metal-binding domain-containing protein [Rhodothermales bacterium]|nr:heavy metal translocating P-type ATPase metal-binding domain-containing protein [Rhodothermales bacterium]MBO6781333.1 heavy metal translocating P-type ATPase metal-binding domain-containing protein [Rhodothermales bacterium]
MPACAHCDLPLGRHVVDEQFCCASCAAVNRLLHASGLADDFYKLSGIATTGPRPAASARGSNHLQFDSEEFLDAHTTQTGEGSNRQAELFVEGVHCAACVWLLEQLPRQIPSVRSARLDLSRARLALTWDQHAAPLSKIADWTSGFGYILHPVEAQESVRRDEERRLLRRVGLAWALAGNVMLLAFAFYAGLAPSEGQLFESARWLSLILAAPAVFGAGSSFFQRAARSVQAAFRDRNWRHLDMDVPIALGLAVGFADSTASVFAGHGELWFDSLTVLTAALLTARLLQLRARNAAARAAGDLAASVPRRARLAGDGRTVSAGALNRGAVIRVLPGEAFPADGTVTRGASSVDASAMTGESRAEPIAPDSRVLAGTVNLSRPVDVRVEATGSASRLGGLLATARHDANRAPVALTASRLAAPFVATVLAAAALTLAWTLAHQPSEAVSRVVALLVITCPCALGMATPLSMVVAMGQAARRGTFIRHEAAVQTLHRVDTVLLDKTGTLTEGTPSVLWFRGSEDALAMAAALERGVPHPVAHAVCQRATSTRFEATGTTVIPGAGVEGTVQGRQVQVGSPDWLGGMRDPNKLASRAADVAAAGLTPVLIAVDDVITAGLGLGDGVRERAPEVVSDLRSRGMRIQLLSGDHPEVARSVGMQLGLKPDEIEGGVSPEDKKQRIRRLQSQGRTVMMVGDGLNDAPALAAADVGVSIDAGRRDGRFAGDIVLTRTDIAEVPVLLDGGTRTLRTIYGALGFSVLYNLAGAAAAATGLVTPLVAAIAMPISSLAVVLAAALHRPFRGAPVKRSLRSATNFSRAA